MGQRFQIITNNQSSIKVYHSQWLWGDYAIRRIGTAVRNYIKYNNNGYRDFEDFLKGSFYGKPNDMNSFFRYFSNPDSPDDNKEIAGKSEYADFKAFLKTLDNNDGYFYIKFNETGLKGYCFITRELKPVTATQYLKKYRRCDFNKKQLKEFNDGLKTFEKLELIEPTYQVKNK